MKWEIKPRLIAPGRICGIGATSNQCDEVLLEGDIYRMGLAGKGERKQTRNVAKTDVKAADDTVVHHEPEDVTTDDDSADDSDIEI